MLFSLCASLALTLILLILPVLSGKALACTCVIVGKKASATGHVIVGHNEDDFGRITVRHGWVSAALHTPDEVLPAEPGCAVIPQVTHTHGFLWSEMKRAEGGLSNSDVFFNDHGVLIVSDNCANSRQDLTDATRLSNGGIAFNLRRALAERASSARHGAEVAAELLSRYGYLTSGRCYIIADANEAWLVQTVSGKHYAAQRVPDDEAAFIPNYYTIHHVDPDDHDNFILSPGLIDYAISKGWYNPASGEPFDFARAYQADDSRMNLHNIYRSAGGYSVLTRHDFWRDDFYPFSVRPTELVTVSAVMEILRSHYEHTVRDPQWARAQSPGGAPHDTTLRRICTNATQESVVAVFHEKPERTTLWMSFGRPCELPYVPIHPLCCACEDFPDELTASRYDGQPSPEQRLATHLLPESEIAAWNESYWQKCRDFQNSFETVYQEHEQEYSRWLNAYTADLQSGESKLQSTMDELEAAGNPDKARQLAASCDSEIMHRTMQQLELFASHLNLVTLTPVKSTLPLGTSGAFSFTFQLDTDRVPEERSLLLVMGGFCAAKNAIRALSGSLKRCDNSTWRFDVEATQLCAVNVKGLFDFYLSGRDQLGHSFGGRCFITLN